MTSRTQRRLNDSLAAYGFIAPAGIILFVFWFFPVVLSFIFSFRDMTALAPWGQTHWVGINQYLRALGDEQFIRSFWNTVNYVIYSVPPTLALSLVAAMLLNTKVRGRAFFRTAFFIPYITTWVAISMVWKFIFQRDSGLANWLVHVLREDLLHMAPRSFAWLSESSGIYEILFQGFLPQGVPPLPLGFEQLVRGPSLSLFAIVVTSVWRDIGYFMLIFLAGLQNIDKSYYEAAEIDGASPWQKFWAITFPLLSPVTFFLLVISGIGAFKVFVPMLVMTPNGGPDYTTAPMVFYMYDKGFRGQWELSYASAVAYLLTLIILLLTVAQNRLFGRRVEYSQ